MVKVGDSAQTFPVEAWSHISLPTFEGDAADVQIQIWDRNREGALRRDPVLNGKGHWKAGEKELRIKLRLELSPREYD